MVCNCAGSGSPCRARGAGDAGGWWEARRRPRRRQGRWATPSAHVTWPPSCATTPSRCTWRCIPPRAAATMLPAPPQLGECPGCPRGRTPPAIPSPARPRANRRLASSLRPCSAAYHPAAGLPRRAAGVHAGVVEAQQQEQPRPDLARRRRTADELQRDIALGRKVLHGTGRTAALRRRLLLRWRQGLTEEADCVARPLRLQVKEGRFYVDAAPESSQEEALQRPTREDGSLVFGAASSTKPD
eukprot:scaffold552_cov526-Prasinococcus_capsulatus_cf.AAC.11